MEQHYQGFLREMEIRNYSPLSILKYARCVRIFFEFLGQRGISDFRKVGRDELREFSSHLTENPKFSLGYVGSNIRAVKLFLKHLKKTGVVLFDFSVYLKEPKMPKALPKEPLTAEQVKSLLEAPDLRTELGIRDRAILETFYSTGIRLSEMAGLTLVDVNKDCLFIRDGKGRKDRVVPLGKHAWYFIQAYLEGSRPVLAVRNSDSTPKLWLNKHGKPLWKGDIVFMVAKYREKAGLPAHVTAHAFRRTLAVELIRNECDFLSVKNILGHSKSETTLRYCALAGVELQEAVKRCHPRYEFEGPEDVVPNIKGFGRLGF